MTPPARGYWPWWPAVSAVVCLLLAPFLLVDVPPLQDYANHLARLYVLAFRDGDPLLAAMYVPRWRVIPNLAIDVIGPPLLHIFPVHVAGRILLAGALLFPPIGAVVYARAAFGSWSPWSLTSAIVAHNALFVLGFMNFLYGVGVALLGGAVWIAARDERPVMAIAAVAAVSAISFFCHLLGVAFFALLIGSEEAIRLWLKYRQQRLDLRAVAEAAAAVVLALAPAGLLYHVSATAEADGPVLWSSLLRKTTQLFMPFLAYDKRLALVIGLAVVATMIALRHRFEARPASVLALAVLVVAYPAVPWAIKGGYVIDARMPLMMSLLLFAGFRVEFGGSQARLLALAAAIVLLARVGSVGLAWYAHRPDLDRLRTAISFVQPGERVLVASTHPEDGPNHAAALLLIERRAFWPLLFADPTQQPLAVRPPYDRIASPLGEPPDYRLLAKPELDRGDLVQVPYLADWRTEFDYVLLIDAGRDSKYATFEPDKLRLLYGSDEAALFKILH